MNQIAGQSPYGACQRALWVIPVADLGGVARHLTDVVREGLPGFELVVLCPAGPLAEQLRHLGVDTIVAEFGPDHGLPASAWALHKAIRLRRPHVVHTHLSFADIVAALVLPPASRRAASSGPALVTTEHGIAADDSVYHGSSWRARLMAQVHHLRLARFQGVIAVSQATADAMRAKWQPRAQITVIPNGVDRTPSAASVSQLPAECDDLRIASIARLAPEKRIELLLAAFAKLHAVNPRAQLQIAGVGELEGELKSLARQLEIADSVSFLGYVDAAQLMQTTDVMAQLSVWENCSYSLLDAVAAGLGVVATRVGGNPEILPDDCLVDEPTADAIAARLLEQADPTNRPVLSAAWPSVSEMAHQIVAEYGRAQEKLLVARRAANTTSAT